MDNHKTNAYLRADIIDDHRKEWRKTNNKYIHVIFITLSCSPQVLFIENNNINI